MRGGGIRYFREERESGGKKKQNREDGDADAFK